MFYYGVGAGLNLHSGRVIDGGSGNDEHHDFTHVFLFHSKFDTKRSFFFFFFLAFFFSLGGSSASYCIIGSCVLIVGSGVRLGLSFHFPLPFCRLNSQLQVCLFASVLVCFSSSFFSLLIFYSHPLVTPFPSILACVHPFLGAFFFLSFYSLFCMPAFPVCLLPYCTAFDIPRSSFLFLPFCCTWFFFSFKYLSSFLRDGIIKKMEGLDLGNFGGGGWGEWICFFTKKKVALFLPSENLRSCHSLS